MGIRLCLAGDDPFAGIAPWYDGAVVRCHLRQDGTLTSRDSGSGEGVGALADVSLTGR
jgi:hypothetical protein